MISAKDLQPRPNGKAGVRIRDEERSITLSTLKEALLQYNMEHFNIPLAIEFDQIKSGGLFNSTIEDCLVLSHPMHTDYFQHVLYLRRQGSILTIEMSTYGYSKLTDQHNKQQNRKSSGTISGMILGNLMGPNESAYQEEYDYYNIIDLLFDSIFK